MFCKFCGAQLDENTTVCASCGKDNAESKTKKLDIKKVVFASVSALLLLTLLIGMLYYGRYGRLFRENDIFYQENYTVTDEKLAAKLEKVVATLGEDKLTNKQLQLFYWMQIYNYGYYYECDFSKPLNEQIMDKDTGKTWQQYFLESAMTNWHQYQLLEQKAKAAGYKIPDEYQKILDELPQTAEKNAKDGGFSSVAQMLEEDFGKGITLDIYQRFFDLFYVGNLYFSDLVEKLEVTDAELEAYYEEHKASLKTEWNTAVTKESGKLVDVRHVLIQPTGGTKDEKGNTVYSEAEWEACREKAQKIYDDWLKGTRDEVTFGDLAYNNSTDSNKGEGGIYKNISKGVMVKEFEDWCFDESRKHGDHGLVKTEYGYHIMFFVGAEEGWVRFCKDGVLSKKADDLLANMLKETPMQADYKAIVLSDVDLSKG